MLTFLLYIHAHTAENMHLIKAAQPQSGVLLVFGLNKNKRGDCGSFIVRVKCFFLLFFFNFHSEMWTLLHRGIIVLVRKRHHLVDLRVEAMKCLISSFVSVWTVVLVCDVTPWLPFIVWHFYMGKMQSAKQGNLLFNFCFCIRSR